MKLVPITIRVSGPCTSCGQINNAQIAGHAPADGSTVTGDATVSCGACGAHIVLTGSGSA